MPMLLSFSGLLAGFRRRLQRRRRPARRSAAGQISARLPARAEARRKIRTTPGTARHRSRARRNGKLAGQARRLKDNIMLAGVPMMNGSATLEGYMPDFDATIVTRMLDAGAEIVGKAHCECLLPVRRQPHQRDRRRAQPAQDGLFGRRLVLRQRRRGGARRSRHGDRRRSGRLDPHAGLASAASTA